MTTDTSQVTFPMCSLGEKAESSVTGSPVSLRGWRWPLARRDVIRCGWGLLTSSLWASGSPSRPPALEFKGRPLPSACY